MFLQKEHFTSNFLQDEEDRRLSALIIKSGRLLYNEMVLKTDCGWWDGGCYTFACALHRAMKKDTQIMHISRCTKNNRDHAIVYFKKQNLYADAFGLRPKDEMFRFMSEAEGLKADVIEPFDNISDYFIYEPVLDDLHQYLTNHLSRNFAGY